MRKFKTAHKRRTPPTPLMLPPHIEGHPPINDNPKRGMTTKPISLEEWRIRQEREEIARKLKERQRRKDLERAVYEELLAKGELYETSGRSPIPRNVRDIVWRRDGGKCVQCGSTRNLQFDHIIPFSKGGATSVENLQILCQKCNLEKSNKIG